MPVFSRGKIPDYIMDDFECWSHTHIAPKSYYDNHWGYISSENADAATMYMCVVDSQYMKSPIRKSWMLWKALYMDGTVLTASEMHERLKIARIINAYEEEL